MLKRQSLDGNGAGKLYFVYRNAIGLVSVVYDGCKAKCLVKSGKLIWKIQGSDGSGGRTVGDGTKSSNRNIFPSARGTVCAYPHRPRTSGSKVGKTWFFHQKVEKTETRFPSSGDPP